MEDCSNLTYINCCSPGCTIDKGKFTKTAALANGRHHSVIDNHLMIKNRTEMIKQNRSNTTTTQPKNMTKAQGKSIGTLG